jgi:hypothetical protein
MARPVTGVLAGSLSVIAARGAGTLVGYIADGSSTATSSDLTDITSIATAVMGIIIALIYNNSHRAGDPPKRTRRRKKAAPLDVEMAPDPDEAMQKQLDEIQAALAELAKKEQPNPRLKDAP